LQLLTVSSFAQREAYSWIWGLCGLADDCSGIYGTAVMRFNDDSIASIDTVNFPSDFLGFSTCISNAEGRLLMASNQEYLFDSSGNILQEFFSPEDTVVYARQSALFFKLKDSSSDYYFLGTKAERIIPPAGYPALNNRTKHHLLTKISADENGFEIISVDTLLRNDTVTGGGIHACRHANGRDWWIFQSTFNHKRFLRGLLTPEGLTFEMYEGPGPDSFEPFAFNKFSPDGSKFFHFLPGYPRKMQIYDFDRCTGELSNLSEIEFADWIENPADFNPFSLSPDGSKIYMGRSKPGPESSYQNIQVNVENSQMTLVADSVYSPCLTPNLKWVVSGYQEVPFTPIDRLNVFTQPNSLGNASGRIKNLYSLPVDGFIIEPPEWANHLLGPIDSTLCDSLGLNDDLTIQKVEAYSLTLFPNPGHNAVNVNTSLPVPLRLTIRNAQGMHVFESDFNKNNFSLNYELNELTPGIYFVEVSNAVKKARVVRKWVKLD